MEKNIRRGKAKIPPRQKDNPEHRACWSDSDEPCRSKFVKYDSGRAVDLKKEGPKYFQSVLGVRKSIVSLVATTDGWVKCCSGTVVDHEDKKTWILTSATLVRKPDTQFQAYGRDDIKIEVTLHNGKTAVAYLPAVELRDLPLYYSLEPRPVIALGRDSGSNAFRVRCGELVREECWLNCKELLVCSCDVDKDFIGGPIMDYRRRFLGITYSYEKTAPFLPVEIAVRCIKYYKRKETLPWLRIRGRALHTLDLHVLETICCKFAGPLSGLLVDKIYDTSIENYGGIEVGDIISALDGAALYSVSQFTAMFLDKFEVAMGTPNAVILQAVVYRPRDKTTFVAKLNVQQIASVEYNKSFQNRWVQFWSYGFDEPV